MPARAARESRAKHPSTILRGAQLCRNTTKTHAISVRKIAIPPDTGRTSHSLITRVPRRNLKPRVSPTSSLASITAVTALPDRSRAGIFPARALRIRQSAESQNEGQNNGRLSVGRRSVAGSLRAQVRSLESDASLMRLRKFGCTLALAIALTSCASPEIPPKIPPVTVTVASPSCAEFADQLATTGDYVPAMRDCLGEEDSAIVDALLDKFDAK